MPHDFKSKTPVKVLIVSQRQLEEVIQKAPEGFGQQPDKYHSDVTFLIGKSPAEVIDDFELNPDVDKVWQGKGVVYFQRLSAMRTKSRLSKIASKPAYKFMTIRTWNTVRKLHSLMENIEP
jgi:uncharacterized protein (DUF1697 family)